MKAMRFKLPRDRTIASTCGISIEFKKNELHLVPPAMFAEVIAAGGVSEFEIEEPTAPVAGQAPAKPEDREAAIKVAFDTIVSRNTREDFTAGNVPHASVLSHELGWSMTAKERDAAWLKYQQTAGDE